MLAVAREGWDSHTGTAARPCQELLHKPDDRKQNDEEQEDPGTPRLQMAEWRTLEQGDDYRFRPVRPLHFCNTPRLPLLPLLCNPQPLPLPLIGSTVQTLPVSPRADVQE